MFDDIRKQHFPGDLVPGFTVKAVDPGVFWAAVSKISEQVFTPMKQLGLYEMPASRQQNSEPLQQLRQKLHREFFLFKQGDGTVVGWSMGEMRKPSDFFMSWTGVLPAFQRHGLYSNFLHKLLPYLQAIGYERVTSKHMVNNRGVLIAKLKVGFIITGMSLDEEVGAQVHLSYLFHDDRRREFEKAFSLEEYAGNQTATQSA